MSGEDAEDDGGQAYDGEGQSDLRSDREISQPRVHAGRPLSMG